MLRDIHFIHIQVTFVNTHGDVHTYRAKIDASSPTNNLELIGLVGWCFSFQPQFQNL